MTKIYFLNLSLRHLYLKKKSTQSLISRIFLVQAGDANHGHAAGRAEHQALGRDGLREGQ